MMYKAWGSKSPTFRLAVTVSCLLLYLAAGLYSEKIFLDMKPIPQWLLEDFGYYERAFNLSINGLSPYLPWQIGTGFLYPPQALLVIEPFAHIHDFTSQVAAYLSVNVLLLCLMVHGVARTYGYRFKDVWYWYVMCLVFAPFWAVLHVGQINIITAFGMFMLFFFEKKHPIFSGCGLSLAIVTKVTPLLLLPYLVINRRYKVIAATSAALVVLTLIVIVRYGMDPLVQYPEMFIWLTQQFILGHDSQSLVSKLPIEEPQALLIFQKTLNIYVISVVAISGALAWASRLKQPREPMFIVTTLAMMLAPNIMWYHHYVFILLPLLVWMGWSRLHPGVVAWCFTGLMTIQLDRWYPPYGLLIHVFGHFSVLYLLYWQVRQYLAQRVAIGADR